MASTQQVLKVEFPDLLDLLKSRFTLTPNYQRALDGRIVDTRFDSETGRERPVTDYEVVKRVLAVRGIEVYGDRIRQTWSFTAADGTALRFNETWEGSRHYGVLHASHCRRCGRTCWNRADRAPIKRCGECYHAEAAQHSGRCQKTGGTCSTGYIKKRCRCEACRTWNREAHRRRRQKRSSVTTRLSPIKKEEGRLRDPILGSQNLPIENKTGCYAPCLGSVWQPENWTWLPADVRAVLADYEQRLQRATDEGATTAEAS